MKVLVIGGSGFIGSHVADTLTDAGHQVTIFDIRPSQYLCKDQRFVLGDMLNRDDIAQAISNQDVVYHFAGITDLEAGLRDPIGTVEQNILGTVITLEASLRERIKRYVYASSVYVYGQVGGFYRCSKQAAELYIEMYQKEFGLPYTILRYGSLYGPRADENNAVRRYLTQALLDGKVMCPGDGEEVREYIHVEDAARSSVEVLAPEFENQCVVLSGYQPMKVRELFEMIQEILNRKIDVVFRSPDASVHYKRTPYNFRPNIGKKFVSKHYLDLGEGLLACLNEIYEKEKDRLAIERFKL